MSGAKTPERITLEKLKVGQSFAFSDRAKQETGRRYAVCKMDGGWRAFRDA